MIRADWAAKANRAIQADLDATVAYFLGLVPGTPPPDGARVEIDIDYAVMAVSIVNHQYVDLGGAHPTTLERGVVVDLARGETVSLPRLFQPGTRYPAVLTRTCQRLLAPYVRAGLTDDSCSGRFDKDFALSPARDHPDAGDPAHARRHRRDVPPLLVSRAARRARPGRTGGPARGEIVRPTHRS